MSDSFELERPERVTVGTVGEPGARTFFLQAASAAGSVSLKLEKQHVAALANALAGLLADLPAPGELPVDLGLSEPVSVDWVVQEMELAYAPALDRVVLVLREVGTGEEGEPPPAVGRLLLTREQAAALARRGGELVEAGRPPCPLCGHPLDPAGHSCPKTNGHRPPTP